MRFRLYRQQCNRGCHILFLFYCWSFKSENKTNLFDRFILRDCFLASQQRTHPNWPSSRWCLHALQGARSLAACFMTHSGQDVVFIHTSQSKYLVLCVSPFIGKAPLSVPGPVCRCRRGLFFHLLTYLFKRTCVLHHVAKKTELAQNPGVSRIIKLYHD